MKAPKFISAMAIAAILSSGVAPAYADFTKDTGNLVNGQPSMQSTDKKDNTNANPANLNDEGEITINGAFNKIINNFPTPTDPGRYLRVTMPIKMDFTYDVDNHQMISAPGTVVNNSVYVPQNVGGVGSAPTPEDQPIKMSLVDVIANGNGSTNDIETEFVDNVDASGIDTNHQGKVVLPFKLNIISGGQVTESHNLTAVKKPISSNNNIQPINIPASSSIQLKLDLIQGQKVGNTDLIKKATSLTSHNLKLKFEYAGK